MQEFKRPKMHPQDHGEVKSLAAKAGVSMIDFFKLLIKAYKGKK